MVGSEERRRRMPWRRVCIALAALSLTAAGCSSTHPNLAERHTCSSFRHVYGGVGIVIAPGFGKDMNPVLTQKVLQLANATRGQGSVSEAKALAQLQAVCRSMGI